MVNEMDYSKLIKQGQKTEIAMDNANAEYGEKDCLCIYCKSRTYDGKLGIIHEINCPILTIRNTILLAMTLDKSNGE